jgi:hypothetical protein
MAGEYGLRLMPLHGGGLRFELVSPGGVGAFDLPHLENVTQAVAAILGATGITRAVFEDGALTVLEEQA